MGRAELLEFDLAVVAPRLNRQARCQTAEPSAASCILNCRHGLPNPSRSCIGTARRSALRLRPAKQPPALLVWCDPNRSWLDLLRAAAQADGFDLWAPASGQDEVHELLVRDRFLRSPRKARVVWLPCARSEITWFKVLELEADGVWERSLLDALREYGVDIPRDHEDELISPLPAHAREWFDKPRETWKELTPGNAKGTLFDDARMLQVLAGEAGEFDAVRAEGKFDLFARRATEDFGWPDPRPMEEGAWRLAVTARQLATIRAKTLALARVLAFRGGLVRAMPRHRMTLRDA